MLCMLHAGCCGHTAFADALLYGLAVEGGAPSGSNQPAPVKKQPSMEDAGEVSAAAAGRVSGEGTLLTLLCAVADLLAPLLDEPQTPVRGQAPSPSMGPRNPDASAPSPAPPPSSPGMTAAASPAPPPSSPGTAAASPVAGASESSKGPGT